LQVAYSAAGSTLLDMLLLPELLVSIYNIFVFFDSRFATAWALTMNLLLLIPASFCEAETEFLLLS